MVHCDKTEKIVNFRLVSRFCLMQSETAMFYTEIVLDNFWKKH